MAVKKFDMLPKLVDWGLAENTLTPEEQAQEAEYARQWQEVYDRYSELRFLYEKLIASEDDENRKDVLRKLLSILLVQNQ